MSLNLYICKYLTYKINVTSVTYTAHNNGHKYLQVSAPGDRLQFLFLCSRLQKINLDFPGGTNNNLNGSIIQILWNEVEYLPSQVPFVGLFDTHRTWGVHAGLNEVHK